MTLGIIGGWGWIGRALTEGVLARGIVSPAELVISGRSQRPKDLPAQIRYVRDNSELIAESKWVVLSIRPEQFAVMMCPAPHALLVSVMAGVSAAALSEKMATQRVIRAMPSPAASIGKSFTPVFATPGINAEEKRLARRIFDTVGRSVDVSMESQLDYMTGLTGSGPAFVALLADAMEGHAVANGLDPDMAHEAVRTTIYAAGEMLERGERTAREIINSMKGYKGTTAAALETMESAGFVSAVESGLAAARRRLETMYPPR